MITRVVTRKGASFTSFSKTEDYIERYEAALHTGHSPNLSTELPFYEQMDETVTKGTGRVRNPSYHYVMSWQKDAVPISEAKAAVERSVEVLGCSDHQYIWASHVDTDHSHVHVLVSRINPTTHRAWTPRFDYQKLRTVAHEIEPQIKLKSGAGRKNRKLQYTIDNRANDHEIWSGQQSMQSWAHERVLPDVERVLYSRKPTWKKLHIAISELHGASYEVNNGVGYLLDVSHDMSKKRRKRARIRASAVSKDLELNLLENRMGPYLPMMFPIIANPDNGYGQMRDKYELPIEAMKSPNVRPLYDKFVREQQQWKRFGRFESQQQKKKLRGIYKRLSVDRVQDSQEAHDLIENVGSVSKNIMHYALATLVKNDLSDIRTEAKQKLALAEQKRPKALFRQWLKERSSNGDTSAGVAIMSLRKKPILTAVVTTTTSDTDPSKSGTTYRSEDEENAVENIIVKNVFNKAHEMPEDKVIERITEAARVADEHGFQSIERDGSFNSASEAFAFSQEILNDESRKEFYANILEKIDICNPNLNENAKRFAQYVAFTIAGRDVLEVDQIDTILGKLRKYLSYAEFGKSYADKINGVTPIPVVEKTIDNTEENTSGIISIKLSDTELEDELLLGGGGIQIGGNQQKTLHDHFTSDEHQESVNRNFIDEYNLYVDKLGGGVYRSQRDLYEFRSNEIYDNYDKEVASLDRSDAESYVRERSLLIARRMKLEGNLEKSYENEVKVLNDVIGIEQPLSYREYLLDIAEKRGKGSLDAKALSEIYNENNFTHNYKKPNFDVAKQIASQLTWRVLDNGKISYKIEDRIAFIDDGKELRVKSSKDTQSAKLALIMATNKFGKEAGLSLTGNDKYKNNMLRLAVELDIVITNPELLKMQKKLQDEKSEKILTEKANRTTEARPGLIKALHDDLTLNPVEKQAKVSDLVLERVKAQIGLTTRGIVSVVTLEKPIGQATISEVLVFSKHAFVVLEKDKDRIIVPILQSLAQSLSSEIGSTIQTKEGPIKGLFEVNLISSAEWNVKNAKKEKEVEKTVGGTAKGR